MSTCEVPKELARVQFHLCAPITYSVRSPHSLDWTTGLDWTTLYYWTTLDYTGLHLTTGLENLSINTFQCVNWHLKLLVS